ncbi:hypothetical protein XH99_02255 [Bradyrhizobium nanningense]|uniref:Uncharacterized protein n=1 Tax=Bradyrhizobium nanningense TaxID=1325118 RepID=A0A4Q0SFW1_9BRAD|nr:hypothetical protein [Bradyrhizobium nanningense]RXH29371.1 hypothetical protein XH84_23085 [Bradyrhizobium nanningense]RXH38097.1 hypothetical protein XH99_02255 [Bradyrhizobium nanningense]
MDKDSQAAKKSMAERKAEVPVPDRNSRLLETGPADRAIKDALEDDEVREALGVQGRDKRL